MNLKNTFFLIIVTRWCIVLKLCFVGWGTVHIIYRTNQVYDFSVVHVAPTIYVVYAAHKFL